MLTSVLPSVICQLVNYWTVGFQALSLQGLLALPSDLDFKDIDNHAKHNERKTNGKRCSNSGKFKALNHSKSETWQETKKTIFLRLSIAFCIHVLFHLNWHDGNLMQLAITCFSHLSICRYNLNVIWHHPMWHQPSVAQRKLLKVATDIWPSGWAQCQMFDASCQWCQMFDLSGVIEALNEVGPNVSWCCQLPMMPDVWWKLFPVMASQCNNASPLFWPQSLSLFVAGKNMS